MGSLVDRLNILREQEANSSDEIAKLTQLNLIKDDEIINLDIELKSLRDFMQNVESAQNDKIDAFRAEIESNQKIIRRTDKLIVDLQQKNELSQNAVHMAQEEAVRKNDQKEKLEMKMKEVSDQRDFFHEQIGSMENKISTYKTYLASQVRAPSETEKSQATKKKKSKTRGNNRDLASISSVSKASSPQKRSLRGN